jgi:hypothetical protein
MRVTASGRGAGREGQGGSWNRACTPPQLKRPRRTGLDTHVPLRSTTQGKGLLPLLRSPLPPCLFGHGIAGDRVAEGEESTSCLNRKPKDAKYYSYNGRIQR